LNHGPDVLSRRQSGSHPFVLQLSAGSK